MLDAQLAVAEWRLKPPSAQPSFPAAAACLWLLAAGCWLLADTIGCCWLLLTSSDASFQVDATLRRRVGGARGLES